MKYDNLLGVPFFHGTTDCYELIRKVYDQNYGIKLTNYARPDHWWDHGKNLYIDNFYREGFRLVDEPIWKIKEGDCLLCAVRSNVANHVGVFTGEQGNNAILHHYYGRFSETVPMSGIFRNAVVAHVRHKDVSVEAPKTTTDILDFLPAHKRAIVEEALRAGTLKR